METTGAPSVPTIRSVRPGWPSLKITTAEAPAAWAFWALTWKVQVPRWISATLPAGKPAKSAASQPLVEVLSGLVPIGTTTSTGVTAAVTSPLPE